MLALVQRDVALIESLLASEKQRKLHLALAEWRGLELWERCAIGLLDAGYTKEEIADRIRPDVYGWTGKESDMLRSEIEKFLGILASKDPRVRGIGELIQATLQRRLIDAVKGEELEAVYGR